MMLMFFIIIIILPSSAITAEDQLSICIESCKAIQNYPALVEVGNCEIKGKAVMKCK